MAAAAVVIVMGTSSSYSTMADPMLRPAESLGREKNLMAPKGSRSCFTCSSSNDVGKLFTCGKVRTRSAQKCQYSKNEVSTKCQYKSERGQYKKKCQYSESEMQEEINVSTSKNEASTKCQSMSVR